MNSITEGKDRELPPNDDGELLKEPMPANMDLRLEVMAASAYKDAGQGGEARARSSIESRTDLRLAATNEAMRADPARGHAVKLVDQEIARQWADLDATDFGRVRSDTRRENALESIAGHVRASPEYAEELEKRSPALAEAARGLNADRQSEEAERSRQAQADQRHADLSAASKTREALIDAASLARMANLRTKQTAALVEQLADAPKATRELIEARDALKAPPLDGRVTAPNDPDIAVLAKRAIKRPIADEELSKALLARFIVSHEKRGLLDKGATEFTFRDGQLQGNVAFVDAGKTLNTTLDDKNTIRAMVEVATAKNWKEITLSGTDDFKRAAWLEARLNGLEVRGYEARDADKKLLAELQQRDRPVNAMTVSQRDRAAEPQAERISPAVPRKHIDGDALTPHETTVLNNSRALLNSKEMGDAFTDATLRDLESRLRGERIYTGILIEHGRAPYQFDPKNDASYYAVLKTRTGEQVVWGKGLADAMTDRKPGENIVLQNIGRKDVVVQERVRDAQGHVVDVRPKDTKLNQWKADLYERVTDKSRTIESRDGSIQPSLRMYDASAPRSAPAKQRQARTTEAQLNAEATRNKREPRPGLER